MRKILLCAALAAMTVWAQPAVSDGGILNAASYANPRFPTGAIAQGSIFVIFGARMGPAALASAPSLPLSTTLGGTSVRVSSGGQNLDCPIVYTSAGQVAAIMPSNTPLGNATLTVSFGGQASVARTVRVVNSSFGTFTINQRGSGPGVVTNFESATSQPVNTVLRPARPGQTLILYGTGLGPLPAGNSDAAAAPAVQINNNNIEVLVGSRRAVVAYAGRAPGFVGLDQINFTVPEGALGCAVSVSVRVGSQVSNVSTIAVSPTGGVCSDPLGLPSGALERISQGGTVKFGAIALLRTDLEIAIPFLGTQSIKTDIGTADFSEFNAQNVVSSSSLNAGGAPSIGSCTVFNGTTSSLTPVDPLQPIALDAGPQLSVNGPRGAKTLTKSNPFDGSYIATLAQSGLAIPGAPPADQPYLEAGNYTISGPGGANVGAFTAQYTISTPLNWTNRAAVNTVTRANGQEVTWQAGSANDYVIIYGYSAADASENAPLGIFTCIERASAGRFTVPPGILLALPASASAGGGGLSLPTSVFGVGIVYQERSFTAPGLDFGVTIGQAIAVKSVAYN